MLKSLSLVLIFSLSSFAAQAKDGLVGFEWTFTNTDMVRNFRTTPSHPELPPIPGRGMSELINPSIQSLNESPINKAAQAWLTEIKRVCPTCTFEGKRVHTPDGFWFEITMDQTVLEVITEPMTRKELIARSETLENLVWKAAKKAYVVPHKRLGGGHLHLDIKSHFGDNRLLFRNFIVDLVNRPELFMGGFGLNYLNAPPLSFYGPEALKIFTKNISDFDMDPSMPIKVLMENLNDFYESLPHPVMPTSYAKFQAINLKHIEMGTIELRAIRPQISVEHAQRLVKMFQSRIKVLKKQTTPIKLTAPDYSNSYTAVRENGFRIYTHDLEANQIMTAVEDYAKDGKLEADFYDDFVTEELKADLKNDPKYKKTSGSKSAGSCSSFL